MAKQKKSLGSVRAKAGLPAKAGRRRPPNIVSTIDRDGKRQWETSNSNVSRKKSMNFGIHDKKKHEWDMYDETNRRDQERKINIFNLKNPKNKDRVLKVKNTLSRLANTQFKSDPFWFSLRWNEFKKGWISMDDIEKGRVA